MASVTNFLPPAEAQRLRPFDVRRDLKPVADLVEKCFEDTLDPDGRSYLQQMRAAAGSPTFMRWAASAAEWASVPLTGYVWEEDGQLVGNINLIPYRVRGKRYFLIANVAVDPAYRRRGIARSLTLRAIDHARRREAPSVWLHVRDQNEAAFHLYTSLGFAERARRTTWINEQPAPPFELPLGLRLLPVQSRHWPSIENWFRSRYPLELSWHLPINLNLLKPGILGSLNRAIAGAGVWQRVLLRDEQPAGAVALQSSRSFADHLWLALPERLADTAAYTLLVYARRYLPGRRALSLDYPAGQYGDAIQAAGFREHQTLVWMEKVF